MNKILIIEDDKTLRENIGELLHLTGYSILSSSNGKKGIELAIEKQPDLILCDIMMDGIDGYGVLHAILNHDKTCNIPFIFLTAKVGKENLRKGMENGADDYIEKPFEDSDLLNAIEGRLKRINKLRKPDLNKANDISINPNSFTIDTGDKINSHYKLYHYKEGDFVFRAGDFPHYLYIIHSGKLKKFMSNPDGKEFISGLCLNGDFVGHKALIENRVYTESAQFIEDGSLYKIPGKEFMENILKSHKNALDFIKLISRKVTSKEKQMIRFAYDSTRKRFATTLINLSEKLDQYEIPLTGIDLSHMVGTSNETISRILSEFNEMQITETSPGLIIIKDIEKLKELFYYW
ncbi:MAG: transcriptional regulator [Marinilabiliales bacterium]|nr:MAG: transcriptional regulator [Marinilabiliales bacterium]